jgi:hypothetical protein
LVGSAPGRRVLRDVVVFGAGRGCRSTTEKALAGMSSSPGKLKILFLVLYVDIFNNNALR